MWRIQIFLPFFGILATALQSLRSHAHVERLQTRKVRDGHPFSENLPDEPVQIYNDKSYKGFSLRVEK